MKKRIKAIGIYSLFVDTYSGWDECDLDIQLYDATLKVDIGEFKAGTTVDTFFLSIMSSVNMVAQIYIGDDVYEFPVSFTGSFGECKKYKL